MLNLSKYSGISAFHKFITTIETRITRLPSNTTGLVIHAIRRLIFNVIYIYTLSMKYFMLLCVPKKKIQNYLSLTVI